MRQETTPGIKGYEGGEERFIKATLSLDFKKLYHDFLPFIPKQPALVIDLGAGIGKDAYELSLMGHTVTAVEPLDSFRLEGQRLYPNTSIHWIDDSLPALQKLEGLENAFDFVLASGVWHHLAEEQQYEALTKVSALLKTGGRFALTLRNGPAGLGTHVFPTQATKIKVWAATNNLQPLLHLDNQSSIMPHKEKVSWTKLVFQKQ